MTSKIKIMIVHIGQRTVARLIFRQCINTGKQTDHPSTRAIVDNSSTGMMRLFARIYTQMDYQKSYRSFPR